jgi:PAS domain S-box-containing protein
MNIPFAADGRDRRSRTNRNPQGFFRIALAIVLTCIALTALVWTFTVERIAYERKGAIAHAQERAAAMTVAFEEHTTRSLKAIHQTLVLLKHEYLQKGRSLDLDAVLEEADIDTRWFTVGIFDAEGRYVGGTSPRTPADVSDRDYFTVHRKPGSKFFISKPTRRPWSGESIMVFSNRIEDEQGRFRGVVALSVAPAYFTRYIGEVDLGAHGLIMLVGLDGVSRARQVGDQVTAGENMAGSRVMALQARQPQGDFLSLGKLDGTPRFAHYRTLAQYPLIVSVGVSERDTLASIEAARQNKLWVGARVTLFLLVTAFLLLFTLVRVQNAVGQVVRSERRFRAIFDQAFVGMTQHDLDGRPIRVNQTTCKILGRTEQEVLGMDPRDVTHADDVPLGGDFAGDRGGGERRFVRPDGTLVWANASTVLVRDESGKPDCFVSVIQDITEFKRLDQMKSDFVSTVSHELRTPLTSIRGSLGLLAGGVAGALAEPARNLIDIALSNCGRLIRLINDILDVEKIESGKIEFEMKVVDLGALLEGAIAANEGFAAHHRVKLELRAPAEPVRVHVDSDRVNQVIANLLSNAVKFSPAGGSIEVTLALTAGRARVAVRDHGPGIPEEFRPRMFQKFSQADSSDTRAKGGTGLGLHISKAIVERLGGAIGFDSETGRGTTFYFDLPCHDGTPADMGRSQPPAAG